jgi:hypothetical protein
MKHKAPIISLIEKNKMNKIEIKSVHLSYLKIKKKRKNIHLKLKHLIEL